MKEGIKNYLKENKLEVVSVLLITFIALMFRLAGLYNNDFFWIDEAFSYQFSSPDTLKEVFSQMFNNDSNMPLFYILYHFWIKFFGSNLFVLGLFPLIFGIIQIPLIFYIAKDLFDKKTAYISTILMTFSAFHIYYSIEMRMYSMLSLFALLSTYFLIKMLQNFSLKNKILFLCFTIFAFYTSNIAMLFVFIQFISALFYVLFKKKENLINFFKIYFILFILAIPGISYLFYKLFLSKASAISIADFVPFKLVYLPTLLEEFFGSYLVVYKDSSALPPLVMPQLSILNFIWYYFPILCGLFLIFLSLFYKNNKVNFLFFISSIVLLLIFVTSAMHLIPYWSRYTFLVYPLIILCFSFVASKIGKYKKFMAVILIFWQICNLYYLFNPILGIYAQRQSENLYEFSKKIRTTDYILDFGYFENYNHYLNLKANIFTLAPTVAYFNNEVLGQKNENIYAYIKSGKIAPFFYNVLNDVLKNAKKGDSIFLFTYNNYM